MSADALELRVELLHEERRNERFQSQLPVKRRWRNKAARAFWAIHVEVMYSARSYAMSHSISPYSQKNWMMRIEDGGLEIDWRAHLHPSARPKISTDPRNSTKVGGVSSQWTTPSTVVAQEIQMAFPKLKTHLRKNHR